MAYIDARATHDGAGNVVIRGCSATYDGAGNVTLTVNDADSGIVIAEDEISLSLVDTSEEAKTATNFLYHDAADGLMIGDKSSGSWNGFRTQITSTAFNVLNSTGDVLASYGAKVVELGKNATDAVIKLCGGKGTIGTSTTPSGTSALSLGSDTVGVHANKSAIVWSDKYEYTEDDNFFYDRYAEFKVDVDPDIAERHKCQIGMVASEHVYQKPIGEGLNDTRHSELFVTPFEIYGFGDDVTFASRNGIAFETVAGDVTVNGRSYGVNKVLFSGAWYGGYSGNTGTITLSEAISSQPHGIVLVFGEYRDGAGQDSGWSYFFVPKQCVDPSRNGGTNFATHHYGGSAIMAKYLYIRDTTINGWANNGFDESGYHSNSSFVLRYVIGV